MEPEVERINSYAIVRAAFILIFSLTVLSSGTAFAQTPQLSLADLLTGLRSKKVSLDERNEILTGAVATRGVTFALTPEIERELLATGAKPMLLDSIRKRSSPVKVIPISNPEPKPAPPDFSFFEKRAAASATAGNVTEALADYSKAIEMNPAAMSSYIGRGSLNLAKGAYNLAINDFNSVLEKTPKNTAAIAGRASAFEKSGKLELARDEFAKLVEFEPDNQSAKTNLTRIQDELAKIAEAQKPKQEPPVKVESKPIKPEMVTVGSLTEADAVKLVKPVYSQIAARARIGGKVVVEVVLDENGSVKSAKAISGPAMLKNECEAAALRSQFKPHLWNGEPIAATGQITYNFIAPRQ
jgi:TonB family protein